EQTPTLSLRRSMAMRPRRSPLPLAVALSALNLRPRQPHRPISEISNRFNLRPLAPLGFFLLTVGRPVTVQSHRRVGALLLPTRSFPGRVFRSLAGQALAL